MNLIGNLLIAPPAMKGNFWYKTVIMITEEHTDGNIGLVLNKRSQTTIREFGEQLNCELDYPGHVYIGGPINSKSLSILHTNDWKCNNTMKINQYFSITSSENMIARLSAGDEPYRWRMFLGFCGWSTGQLLSEIKGKPPFDRNMSWCTATSNIGLAFDLDNKDQWCAALNQSGIEFAQNLL